MRWRKGILRSWKLYEGHLTWARIEKIIYHAYPKRGSLVLDGAGASEGFTPQRVPLSA